MADTPLQCSCWRCWFQRNFTPLALLLILVMGFIAMVVVMHENSVPDTYEIWLEGFVTAALTSLGVSLKGAEAQPQHPPAAPPTPEETTHV